MVHLLFIVCALMEDILCYDTLSRGRRIMKRRSGKKKRETVMEGK